MLRMHFTAGDLARTRFACAPAPLLELGLALAVLQRREVLFDGWRARAGGALPHSARPLLELVPPTGTGPLFLDPISAGLEDGCDAVLGAPAPLVRRELRRICANGQPITPWIKALHEQDRDAWRVLGHAVRSAHAALIAPAWPRIWQIFREDVATRAGSIAEAGLLSALEKLHPAARWRADTLEIDAEVTLSVHLDGRGLTLLPSAFWTGRPLIAQHPDGSALVVYPALRPLPLAELARGDQPLAELLGRTRAAVLALTTTPCSTSQIARKLGISAASASRHASILRAAGLLVTGRDGKAVRHSLTPLGARLLSGGATPPLNPSPAATRAAAPASPTGASRARRHVWP